MNIFLQNSKFFIQNSKFYTNILVYYTSNITPNGFIEFNICMKGMYINELHVYYVYYRNTFQYTIHCIHNIHQASPPSSPFSTKFTFTNNHNLLMQNTKAPQCQSQSASENLPGMYCKDMTQKNYLSPIIICTTEELEGKGLYLTFSKPNTLC